jgi:hypothetical protein
LKEICGFNRCESLEDMDSTASVETITGFNTVIVEEMSNFNEVEWRRYKADQDFHRFGLRCCASPVEVCFAEENRIREVLGFLPCSAIPRVENPRVW